MRLTFGPFSLPPGFIGYYLQGPKGGDRISLNKPRVQYPQVRYNMPPEITHPCIYGIYVLTSPSQRTYPYLFVGLDFSTHKEPPIKAICGLAALRTPAGCSPSMNLLNTSATCALSTSVTGQVHGVTLRFCFTEREYKPKAKQVVPLLPFFQALDLPYRESWLFKALSRTFKHGTATYVFPDLIGILIRLYECDPCVDNDPSVPLP